VIYIGIHKCYLLAHDCPGLLITDQPYFYIALTCMLLGSQFFLAGFVGELISRNAPERNRYDVAEVI
jgi:hypothetical protein